MAEHTTQRGVKSADELLLKSENIAATVSQQFSFAANC
jgi:hypothetical protein